jgi:glycosyltransferase involved in cell wall biosynthesis
MRRVALVVPGSIEARTGGSIYDRRIAEGLRARGWTVDVIETDVGSGFRRIAYALRPALQSISEGALVLVDGLLSGSDPDTIELEASRLRLIPIAHLPLADDPCLPADQIPGVERRERRTVAAAAAVVATGSATVATLVRYGVPADRIALITPGTDWAPVARGSDGPAIELLSVATINTGKGHESLIRALASIRAPEWRLICAGSIDRDPPTVARVRHAIAECGLQAQVTLAGELDEARLAAAFDRADLFVLATRHESFGMAVAEAIARALPVVSTTVGAIPELTGAGGLLVAPEDQQALNDALARVLRDDSLRASLRAGARAARERLTTWDSASDRMSAVLASVAADGRLPL